MATERELSDIEQRHGFQFHDSYRRFLLAFGKAARTTELVAWEGVSKPGPAAERTEDEDSVEYWLHDMSELFGLSELLEVVEGGHLWWPELMSKGYPIGQGYDGSLYIQATDGAVYHCYGDDWIEDEDHEELAATSADEFYDDWGHHHLADDFESFYRALCEQRGARKA